MRGTDPLNEFKREAYKLYEEFRGFISKQVANNIFRVQVQQVPQQQTFPMPIPAQFGETGTNVSGANVSSAQADQITPVEGGHVHSDGTFHADAPVGGNGGARTAASAAAAAPAVVPPALAAVSRRGIQYQHGEETASEGAATASADAAKPAPVTNNGPKIGRNDPCWCGSGKKYKRCHGS